MTAPYYANKHVPSALRGRRQVVHYMRDVDGSRSWQIAGRWGVLWSPRGRHRLFSERNGLAPSGWRDVRVGRTAELSFAQLRRWRDRPGAMTRGISKEGA